MRDPKRLDKFYKELCKIHKEVFTDLRFGQLICNFFSWIVSDKHFDPFFPEEDRMLELLKEYVESLKTENKEEV